MPAASSNLPESRPGKPVAFCLVLLRMGFTCAPPVTRRAVVSYSAFPPLPGPKALSEKRFVSKAFRGGLFLLHWPWSRLHRTLSGILPCEARTFLTSGAVYFCCTGLGVASTGRYPASCPVKPGLSSPAAFSKKERTAAIIHPTHFLSSNIPF